MILGYKNIWIKNKTTSRKNASTLKLVDTSEEVIYSETIKLLNDKDEYSKMSRAVNPYGDGTASKQIVDAIIERYKGVELIWKY